MPVAALDGQANEPDRNALKIVPRVMSGASAKGVCTTTAMPALIDAIESFDPDAPSLPRPHRIEVKELSPLNTAAAIGRVSSGDLQGTQAPSILTGDAIERPAGRAPEGGACQRRPYPFTARDPEPFITCTNLSELACRAHISGAQVMQGRLMGDHAHIRPFHLQGARRCRYPAALARPSERSWRCADARARRAVAVDRFQGVGRLAPSARRRHCHGRVPHRLGGQAGRGLVCR
jgi:hypothetical protein